MKRVAVGLVELTGLMSMANQVLVQARPSPAVLVLSAFLAVAPGMGKAFRTHPSRPPTGGELQATSMIARARELYVTDAIDVDEFERRVHDALHGRALDRPAVIANLRMQSLKR